MLVVILSSCSKEGSKENDSDAVSFTFDTKAVQSFSAESTFRIMMYNENDRGFGESSNGEKLTGTYYLKENVPELVACELNDDGSLVKEADGTVKENPENGVNGVNGKINLVLVSPGVICNDDGSFDFVPDADQSILVSAPELRTVGGYGPVRLKNPQYDPRSTLSFEFYKKPEVDDFTVVDSKVEIIGVQEKDEVVKIYPALRQVRMLSNSHARTMPLTADAARTPAPSLNDYQLFYYTGEDDVLHVASGIYASKEEAYEYLGILSSANVLNGNYIYMSCVLSQKGREIQMRMPLNDKILELRPQYHYVYKVLVESDYINVMLEVYDGTSTDWSPGGTISSEIGTLSETIQIGRWVNNGWESAGNIDFVVG